MGQTVCIDFDGAIAPSAGRLLHKGPPDPAIAGAVATLRDMGYRIVILTSRLSTVHSEAELAMHRDYIAYYLSKYGIEVDLVTADKVPAKVYFDDRAWRTNADMLASDLQVLALNGGMDQ